jgi:Fe-S cluster assembly protein SufD
MTTLLTERLLQEWGRLEMGGVLAMPRRRAWDHFLELGLPEKGSGPFQYVPLRQLYEVPWRCASRSSVSRDAVAPHLLSECRGTQIVFVDGRFSPELSDLSALPKGVVVLPLTEATRSYGTFLQGRWSRFLKEETNPFAVVNLALHAGGVFIYVPPKTRLQQPVQCLYFAEGKDVVTMPRIHLFLASQAELSWISTVQSDGWMNRLLDVAVEDGAIFRHVDWSRRGGAWDFPSVIATQKRGSKFEQWSMVGEESQMTRSSVRAALLGEDAELSLQGVWNLRTSQHVHVHMTVSHEAPHTRSLQKFRGVLGGVSHSSFDGKIVVKPSAPKTEAYQLSQHLLLGEYAVANAKPNLEIFEGDVKASHGATIGSLDEEEIFYLRSRGLPQSAAEELLVTGFCREIVQTTPFPFLYDRLLSTLHPSLT